MSGEIATYTYEIRDHEDANLLTNMVEAVNAVMKEKKVKQKINLTIREEFVSRAYRSAVWLSNYYESEEGTSNMKPFSIYILGKPFLIPVLTARRKPILVCRTSKDW